MTPRRYCRDFCNGRVRVRLKLCVSLVLVLGTLSVQYLAPKRAYQYFALVRRFLKTYIFYQMESLFCVCPSRQFCG